uniref:Uncharacterized protein n=1 Tax=Glypta fumiferanae TaxID=389681 RepID=A0A0F6Q766_9HYME|nr:hypothetical protein [Glypta fumiferanae]
MFFFNLFIFSNSKAQMYLEMHMVTIIISVALAKGELPRTDDDADCSGLRTVRKFSRNFSWMK